MARPFHAVIEKELRRILNVPELIAVIDPRFAAGSAGHRENLRREILHRLGDDVENPGEILDLSKPLLKAGGSYVSIAHVPSGGGFLLSKQPIGLDLEEADRVQSRVVARVSTADDLSAAPSPAWLWAAKEAAFKALQHAEKSPKLLSQIGIDEWVLTEENSHCGTFRVRNLSEFSSRAALGCVIHAEGMIVSAFSIAP